VGETRIDPYKFAIVASLVAFIAGYCLIQFGHPPSRQVYISVFDTYQCISPLVSGIFGLLYAFRMHHGTKSRQMAWMCIGLGCLSWGLGQVSWTYYELALHRDAPFPGLPDLGYFCAYPLIIGGIFLLFGEMPVAARFRLVVDGALGACGIGIISWYFVVQNLWMQSGVSSLAKFLGMAYPLGDVVILFGALVLMSGSTVDKGLRQSVTFIVVGAAMLALADGGYAYYTLNETYHTGMWTDTFWCFGWLTLGGAFAVPLYWRRYSAWDKPQLTVEPADAVRRFKRLIGPYAVAVIALTIVILHDFSRHGSVSASTVASGYIVVFIVILRQVTTLIENQRLSSDLQRQLNENEILNARLRLFNEELEMKVAKRTSQMTSLHQLTREVSRTYEVDGVASVTAANLRNALHCDGTLVWIDSGECRLSLKTHIGFNGHEGVMIAASSCASRDALTGHSSVAQPIGNAALIMAPLVWRDKIIGAVGAVKFAGTFDLADTDMIEAIGVEVGSALAHAQQYELALSAADRDPITGLLNHRALHQRLDHAFLDARDSNGTLALVMMDLNNFRLFNDTYGHPVGDVILSTVSTVLTEETCGLGTVGRYGGDEFLIIMPDADTQAAIALAERLQARFGGEGFQRPSEDRTIPITVSFGVASMPEDTSNRHELLSLADRNLFTAKQSADKIAATSSNQRSNREVREEATFSILDAIVTAVDNKDRYTRRHSEDVSEYAMWIAEEIGLRDEALRVLRAGSLLHDVGKIAIPGEVLSKPGRLTDAEYAIMKEHAHLGWMIVKSIPGTEPILDAIRYHHERWDGAGYPDQLQGDSIPLVGRILAVADAYSAMTTDRPYRKGMDWERAREEIRTHSGTQFDPELAAAFLQVLERKHAAGDNAHSDDALTAPLQRAA
jgi:diguanylate cyclase (GGDEF)-like protein/putative nucleotidyltransferase with HDIG domain